MTAKHRLDLYLAFAKVMLVGRQNFSGRVLRVNRMNLSQCKLFAKAAFYERSETQLLAMLDSFSDGAFIDVGANIGHTLIRKIMIGSRKPYIGLEPQLGACHAVDDLIKRNRIEDAVILPVGLSDRTEIARFGVSMKDDVAASINMDYRPTDFYKSFQSIVVVRGDELFRSSSAVKVGLLKIDVEGAEAQVFSGMTDTLQRHRPVTIFELLPFKIFRTKEMVTGAVRQERLRVCGEIGKILSECRYSVFTTRGANAEIVELDRLEPHDHRIQDVVGVPTEKFEEFKRHIQNWKPSA